MYVCVCVCVCVCVQHKYVAQASAIHAALLDAYNLSDGSGASTDMSAVQVERINTHTRAHTGRKKHLWTAQYCRAHRTPRKSCCCMQIGQDRQDRSVCVCVWLYACVCVCVSQVRDIPDDGYIVQNMAHHLLGCNRLGCLRGLLGEPAWLESKLHAYGTAAVVADFRRYTRTHTHTHSRASVHGCRVLLCVAATFVRPVRALACVVL